MQYLFNKFYLHYNLNSVGIGQINSVVEKKYKKPILSGNIIVESIIFISKLP